jgi:hypothetical protein
MMSFSPSSFSPLKKFIYSAVFAGAVCVGDHVISPSGFVIVQVDGTCGKFSKNGEETKDGTIDVILI